MTVRTVRTGSPHDCVEGGAAIPTGSIASKSWRKAETYRECCHADRRGNSVWYRHVECTRSTP